MKALRLYIPLVGLPLLGLLVVLHAGERLTAPPGLRGEWAVRAVSSTALPAGEPRSCLAAAAAGMLHRFSVEQSGPRIEVTLRNPEGEGWARSDARVGTGAASGAVSGTGNAACVGTPRLTLVFTGLVPDSVRGTIAPSGCDDCPTVRFTAVRRRRTGVQD